MGLLAFMVGLGALAAWFAHRDRKPTAREDERARAIGEAIRAMPILESLGAKAPPDLAPAPVASFEPDGDKVVRIDVSEA